jgi:putative ABC transport system permease protein
MIGQMSGVTAVQDTGTVNSASAYRTPYIPSINTNALTIAASTLDLPPAVGTSVAQGRYLNAATAREPVAVLGAAAAQRLGFDRIWPGMRMQVGGIWFYVVGILNPAILAPEVDSSILVGFPAAEHYLGFDGHPSEIYVRAQDSQVVTVDNLLAGEANPENPCQVNVSQPSAALTAKAAVAGAFDTLFLGLGAVALLVGAVGVANIMVISVLERRQEIGLRRALGATRGQIRIQFLSEAILLALAGGAARVIAAPRPPPSTRTPGAGPSSSPSRPGRAAWARPCSSVPRPGCCPPSAPPACPRPRRSGPSEPAAERLLRGAKPEGGAGQCAAGGG